MNNKGVITRGMAILAALILIIIIGIVIAVNVGKSTNVNKYKDFLETEHAHAKSIGFFSIFLPLSADEKCLWRHG